MQNLQVMRAEPREEDQSVNIVLRSGIMTDDDKGKQPKEGGWVCKAPKKEFGFDLECAKKIFMEAKKTFAEASTSGSQNKVQETSASVEVDSFVLTTFLETYIKLLRDSKVVEGLQELIIKCASKEKSADVHHVVRKTGKHKAQTRCEMRLTVHIGYYEMDQVILDMGSDVNVFPQQA